MVLMRCASLPYNYLPDNLPRGTHTVQVRAYDRAENKVTKDIRVIVR